MRYNAKRGWYKILNPGKFIKPLDEYMQSTKMKDNDCYIQYKSSLERIAFCYADLNPRVAKFSIEPFNIPYVKPTDNKVHRYFIDMLLVFETGETFLVEIKSYGETIPPNPPKIKNANSMIRYQEALETYMTNQAKWTQAKQFAEQRGFKFIVLTEKQLKI